MPMKRHIFKRGFVIRLIMLGSWFTFMVVNASGQDRAKYLVGADGQLEMIVHIIGEIRQPGEYRVPDTTTLMELISKAQGPTEYSNLGGVTITRIEHELQGNGHNDVGRLKKGNKVIKYDVNDYLKKGSEVPPPVLKPGDVILVPRNNWHRWRNTFTILRDLSVIASLYWLVERATRN
jgi:protein involved in polysaccharide export with SLBB domain